MLADPPWSFKTYSEKGEGRSAKRWYETGTFEWITALDVQSLAADDSVLLLWAINSMLPNALSVMASWGFAFKTVAFTWAKQTPTKTKWHIGMGYWTRQNTESCLLGTRGSPKRLSKAVRQLVVAPRREHSRKPDEVYAAIEALLPGPRIELFARTQRPGWTSWGLEVGKFP